MNDTDEFYLTGIDAVREGMAIVMNQSVTTNCKSCTGGGGSILWSHGLVHMKGRASNCDGDKKEVAGL